MQDLEYKLVRSRRRTLALEIKKDGGLLVRSPLKFSTESVHRFIEQKKSWIERKQKEAIEKNRLRLLVPKLSDDLVEYHKKLAEQKISERLGHYASRLGISYRRYRISSARSRWGSCARSGRLSFSWRLAMAPAPVLDYVIIHELIHILEHNHSGRFWEKVKQICPEYKRCKQWLKENDHLLVI
jgi:predicted metal-dependent hydrolase